MPTYQFIQLMAAVVVVTATGCAYRSEIVDHAFSFDVRRDNPGVRVLDYRYGRSDQPSTVMRDWQKERDQRPQQASINGPMPRPDSLYVKWIEKRTKQEHEDTVDLKSRLPINIKNHRVTFVPRGAQLYVYLITQELRSPNDPVTGPNMYASFKAITIYPDPSK
ncbi:hypothetical protein GCM10027343_43050 [Noviherbaspirillum agri]